MTVSVISSIAPIQDANGVTRNWAFPFSINDATQVVLVVYAADGSSVMKTGNDITVNFVKGTPGGTVVYPNDDSAPLAAGYHVTPIRRVSYDQPTRIGNQGAFFPQVHEDAFDYIVMQIQQIRDFGLLTNMRANIGDPIEQDLMLPRYDARAGKILEFDDDGLPITERSVADVLGQAETAVAAADASAASATASDASADLAEGYASAANADAASAHDYMIAAQQAANDAAVGGVQSFNGRNGAVSPAAGDYEFDDISNTPTTLAGYGITDAAAKAANFVAFTAATGLSAGRVLTDDVITWSIATAGQIKATIAAASVTFDMLSDACKASIANLGFTTGDLKPTWKTAADSGWIMANDGTVGDAASGADYANANASALFTLLYGFSDGICPLLNSGGGATTRGAQGTAAAAFAAHCRVRLPKTLGRFLGIAGSGSGLTARALGDVVGSETHTQTGGEVGQHTHPFNYDDSEVNDSFTGPSLSGGMDHVVGVETKSGTTGTNAAPSAMNIMNPGSYIKLMVKL